MATDLLTGPSDAARTELLERATDRGFVLSSELAEIHDPDVHGSDLSDLTEEVLDLGIEVVDDRGDRDDERIEAIGYSDDPVRQYLNEAGRYELLDAQEEQDLAKRYRAGIQALGLLDRERLPPEPSARLGSIVRDGEAAKEHLIRANLRLVLPTAKRYAGPDQPLVEVIQDGNLGLIRAVEKFDHTKGYKFSTYAVWWIRQAIQRGVASSSRTVRIPGSIWEQSGRVRRARSQLQMKLGREPNDDEIAAEADLTTERVQEIRDALRPVTSLDTPVGEGGEISLGDLLPDTEVNDPEVDSTVSDIRARLIETLTTLPERERTIIELRYGLRDGQVRSLAEVADEIHLSRERVRQLEKESLADLRDRASAQGLEHVFDALAA